MKSNQTPLEMNRRALLSTIAALPVLSAPLASVSASAQTATLSDALPSWNERAAKRAILDFVRDTRGPAQGLPDSKVGTFTPELYDAA
jgi:hypothetical protein